jgi:hypothetical protein
LLMAPNSFESPSAFSSCSKISPLSTSGHVSMTSLFMQIAHDLNTMQSTDIAEERIRMRLTCTRLRRWTERRRGMKS